MLKLSILILFFSCEALSDPPLIPVGITNFSQYGDAFNAAQRATLMQIGFTQEYNKNYDLVTAWGSHEGYSIIDNYSPVSRNTLVKFFSVGYAAYVVSQRQLQASFDDPFIKNMKHDLSVNQQGGTLNIRFPL